MERAQSASLWGLLMAHVDGPRGSWRSFWRTFGPWVPHSPGRVLTLNTGITRELLKTCLGPVPTEADFFSRRSNLSTWSF